MLTPGIETSNGIAAHLGQEQAQRAAINELAERDLFLCHYLTKTPLAPLCTRLLSPECLNLNDWLLSKQAQVYIRRLGAKGAVVIIDGHECDNPFGLIVGLGLKEDQPSSIVSALIEAGRRAHRLISHPEQIKNISLQEFAALRQPTFTNHGQLALNLDYTKASGWLVGQTPVDQQFNKRYDPDPATLASTIVERLRPSEQILLDCPIEFARATNSSMQGLFAGATSSQHVNLERLSQFNGRGLSSRMRTN